MMRIARLTLVALGILSLAACFGGKKIPPTLLTLTSEAPAPASVSRTAAPGEAITIDVPVVPKELASTRVPAQVGAIGEQGDFGDLADGDAGEGHRAALVEAADILREIDVDTLFLGVRQAGQPDHEQQQAGEERKHHAADEDMVRPCLHCLPQAPSTPWPPRVRAGH